MFPDSCQTLVKFLTCSVVLTFVESFVFYVYVLTGCKGMWDNFSCWHHSDFGEVVVNTCPAALKSLFTRDGNFYFNICKLLFIHFNMIRRSKIDWYWLLKKKRVILVFTKSEPHLENHLMPFWRYLIYLIMY